MDGEQRDIDFGVYDFGTVRTLAEYESYSGLNFKKRGVQQYTLDNHLAPNPFISDSEEYEASFSSIFKHCIDIGFNQVPYDDYTFWAVAFEDENGVEIYRQDADRNEITQMKNDPDGYCKVWRSFNAVSKPFKWIVWPHSLANGWGDRMEGFL
jgi:hypothetical protein